MISNVTPHQTVSHLPFRPIELNDKDEWVSRKLPNAKWRIFKALVRLAPHKSQVPPERKSLRTFMFDDSGQLQDARIDLRTGEVMQFAYARQETMLKARPKKDAIDEDPFWMQGLPDMPTSYYEEYSHGNDRSRRKRINRAKTLLEHYVKLEEATEDYPIFDHVLTGGAELSLGGNTRPLNRGRLFHMLQHLHVISPCAVRDLMGYSKSHSEKVVNVLRVVEAGFVRLLERRTPYVGNSPKQSHV
jgi:hypothetical protein